MADTEFITARFPDAEMPRTGDRADMLLRVRQFIPPGVEARLRVAGGEFGPWRPQREIIDRITRRLDFPGVGPKLILQRQSGDRDMLSIREVTRVPDLGAAPAIEEIHAWVWDRHAVRSGGLWLCRFVDGTTTVSKHGYQTVDWKGAAEDIFVTTGGMPALLDVAHDVVNTTKAGKLHAATVIVDQQIWTPTGGWRVYGGQRHFHAHVDCVGGVACRP